MRPDFELLAAFLVDVRGAVLREPVRLAVFTISFVLLSSTR